jgi:hypothetical protein
LAEGHNPCCKRHWEEDQTGIPINFKEDVTAMCDYSLHHYKNRLAQVGETLIVNRFPSSTLGLASPAELQAIADEKANQHRPRFWSAIIDFFSAPAGEKVPAVCIPPGAQLRLRDIPTRLQRKLNVRDEEEVVFTQLSADPDTHRDAVRFRSGREVLLQELDEGQRVFVISVSLPDELPDRKGGGASAHHVPAARMDTVGQF